MCVRISAARAGGWRAVRALRRPRERRGAASARAGARRMGGSQPGFCDTAARGAQRGAARACHRRAAAARRGERRAFTRRASGRRQRRGARAACAPAARQGRF
jgi:hypothetical protein